MTTDQSESATASKPPTSPKRSSTAIVWILGILGVAAVAAIAYNARNYPDQRVGNPEVTGAPRPVKPLLGFGDWLTVHQVGCIIAMAIISIVFLVGWRRRPGRPALLMALVTTLIVWQDPIMNWAPFAVYNPQLWHWPESWPLVSLSPTVEPFVVVGYVMFYFAPYFPAVWLLRKIQARRPVDSFVSRHPLICLAGLILVIGFLFDAWLEISLVRTGLYIYSQAIPFGTLFAGDTYQFPLLWESLAVTFVMIPAGVLVYRDDTGRSVAEKLAQRARIFPRRPVLGTFVVMFLIINVAYFAYGTWFAVIKWSGAATSVACPWPYPEAKVYDPQGFYEENGQPGPYSVGIWSTWMSGQPDGRPNVDAPKDGGRCGPGSE